MEVYLQHHGLLGQKWGVRRFQNADGSLTSEGRIRYGNKNESPSVIINSDGSKTFQKGFKLNRVGKSELDVNKSGGLYVSYGDDDLNRYVKALGPSLLANLFNNAATTIQHLSVKENLKMPSDNEFAKECAKALRDNSSLLESFNSGLYSIVYTDDFEKKISNKDLEEIINDPKSKSAKKFAYSVNSFFGDPKYVNETKTIYSAFRDKGYDALPDLHDTMSGTSKTAFVVINPSKISVDSTTTITKDTFKEAKKYVKSLEKLPVDDLIK